MAVLANGPEWTSIAALPVSVLALCTSAATLYLTRRRRLQIATTWESRLPKQGQKPMWGIKVSVQNDGTGLCSFRKSALFTRRITLKFGSPEPIATG